MNIKRQYRCRKLGILPKFERRNSLKIQEYPSIDDSEDKKRLFEQCNLLWSNFTVANFLFRIV